MRFFVLRIAAAVPLLGLAALTLSGCRPNAGAPPAMPPAKVTVAHPVVSSVQSYLEYNGHLEAVETVEIRARVKGLLKDVHFVEGQEVQVDTPLYTIDPREYVTAKARATADLAKADADIKNWDAQIKLAETEYSRVVRLPAGTVTQSEIDKAKATVDVNRAQLAVAQANKESAAASLQTATIQLSYTDIRSPIAGRISRTLVTKGNLVGQDQPTLLTTIRSVDPLFVYFDAPERDLLRYQAATGNTTKGEAPLEVGVGTEIGFPHLGKIDWRENQVDVGTGTIHLRGRVPNTPDANGVRLLYPGLYSHVRVPAGPPEPRPVIPEEALMTGQEGRFVFVIGANDIIEKRVVTLGTKVWQEAPPGEPGPPGWTLANENPPAEGAKGPLRLPVRAVVAIEKGLTANDRIVVVGLQKARPGAPVAPENWVLRPPPQQ
jgi:RND family efflux transporter MFP subunit